MDKSFNSCCNAMSKHDVISTIQYDLFPQVFPTAYTWRKLRGMTKKELICFALVLYELMPEEDNNGK